MCPRSPHRCNRILIPTAHCRYNNNKQAYFTYDGSLTTPDCNEQVRGHIYSTSPYSPTFLAHAHAASILSAGQVGGSRSELWDVRPTPCVRRLLQQRHGCHSGIVKAHCTHISRFGKREYQSCVASSHWVYILPFPQSQLDALYSVMSTDTPSTTDAAAGTAAPAVPQDVAAGAWTKFSLALLTLSGNISYGKYTSY
jgi:hypothetical protein